MLESSQMESDDLPGVNRDDRCPAIASESGAVISEQFERTIIVRHASADHPGEGDRENDFGLPVPSMSSQKTKSVPVAYPTSRMSLPTPGLPVSIPNAMRVAGCFLRTANTAMSRFGCG